MNVIAPRIDYNIPEMRVVQDDVLMPILKGAGIVAGFDGIIPAAVYGKEPRGIKDLGSIGVVYGSYDELIHEVEKTLATPKPYFNPHGAARTKGASLAKKAPGRGDTFAKSAYLLQSKDAKSHLVIEGKDMPWFDQKTARQIVTAYDLAAITIARTVTITETETDMTELSPLSLLPGLLRETAQNIMPSIKNRAQQIGALENAMQMLVKGQAPTY